MHASPHHAFLSFQGPLLLSFEEDPRQQPLELAMRQVSSKARAAWEKVSCGRGRLQWTFPCQGSKFKAGVGKYVLF